MKLKTLFLLLMCINILALILVVFSIDSYHNAMRQLEKAYVTKNRSFLLADELRQSSDDLTRLARTYVITGNLRFKEQFFDVLDIRNGLQPRPKNYNRIYWDFMAIEGDKPRPDGQAMPLRTLMKQAGFTQKELQLLSESQNQSDALVFLERKAMNAVEGMFMDSEGTYTIKGDPDFKLAREIMHSEEYHRIKVDIMKPLDTFFQLFEARTDGIVQGAKEEVRKIEDILGWAIILLIVLVFASIAIILSRVLHPLEALNRVMLRLADNDMDTVIPHAEHLDEMGEMIGSVRIFKENAQKLIVSEQKNKLLLDSAGEGIFGLDTDGRFTFLNPAACEFLGYEPEELSGRAWYETIHTGEVALKIKRLMLESHSERTTGILELIRQDGSVFPAEYISTPTHDEKGWLSGAVVVFSDITLRRKFENDLKAAKESAEEANHAKSLFLANMSHELRTPLNAILGFARLLKRNDALKPTEKENLETIHRSGTHLLNLINEILEMAKLQAGKMTIHTAPFDLHRFIQNLTSLFESRMEEKGLKFELQFEPSLPRVISGDEQRLQQILINLLGNALKFTDQGQVRLAIRYEKNRLLFDVQDSGCGIAKEEQGLIFKPFEQVRTRKAAQQGTGLGLAISQELIHLMEGEINVSSNEGEGSHFSFFIHVEEAEADVDTGQKSAPIQMPEALYGAEEYTVLIVDDIDENRALLVQMLQMVGFTIMEAKGGKQALEIMSLKSPDMVFLDIQMPDMSGDEVLKAVRADPEIPAIPIIAISANVFQENREKALRAGADRFINKPIDEQELMDVIQQFLGLSFQEQPLTEKCMETLSSDVRQEILDAALRLDSKKLEELFERYEKNSPEIISRFRSWVSEYEHQKIIDFCKAD